jgi:hypothetical protein
VAAILLPFAFGLAHAHGGWVIDSALGRVAQPGETFTTTTRLNVWAEPNTSAKVLLVMP